MGKALAWICLVIGVLIILFSLLQAVLLFTEGTHSGGALVFFVGFRAFALALGVSLVVFARRRLQWIREEAAYYKAVGERPAPDFSEFEDDDLPE
ncbi:MAG: hypothetical protein JXL80_01325 [Planctomycetes bacterium]|nr:hypothetical protein [Planctomycetota bacterium]